MGEPAIRPFQENDQSRVIALWQRCGLVVAWNDPVADIAAKRRLQPELFFVGCLCGRIVSTAMAGYDGHRGWIYYLAVDPRCRKRGYGRAMVTHVEKCLADLGCSKINLQVRTDNRAVVAFYEHLGFSPEDVVSLGKKL